MPRAASFPPSLAVASVLPLMDCSGALIARYSIYQVYLFNFLPRVSLPRSSFLNSPSGTVGFFGGFQGLPSLSINIIMI